LIDKMQNRAPKNPAIVLDSGSKIAIVTEDIVLRDGSIKHDLSSGIATLSVESIGFTNNLYPQDVLFMRILQS
jgi:hypothetical protein